MNFFIIYSYSPDGYDLGHTTSTGLELRRTLFRNREHYLQKSTDYANQATINYYSNDSTYMAIIPPIYPLEKVEWWTNPRQTMDYVWEKK